MDQEGACGGRRRPKKVNHHVLDVDRTCLKVYFMGHSKRGGHDADDVVQGFFADRLNRSDSFDKWQASGKRLRHWLINGFNWYVDELRRPEPLP